MLLNKISAVFPQRSLDIVDTAGGSKIVSTLFIGCLFLGIMVAGVGMVFSALNSQVPGLLRDFAISKDAEPFDPFRGKGASSTTVTPVKGQCTTKYLVLVRCAATLNYITDDGQAASVDITLALFDFHFGKYSASPVRSASRPEKMTIDLAIDTLWQRVFHCLVTIAFGVVMIAFGPFVFMGNRRSRRRIAALSGKRLIPVSLRIRRVRRNTSAHTLYVSYEVDISSGVKKYVGVFVGDEPFMLDETHMLGVSVSGSDYAYPIDASLRRLSMNEAERAVVFQAAGLVC